MAFVRILLNVNLSLIQTFLTFLLYVNLDDSIDSGNLSVRSFLPLIRKDSITHMHRLAVYMKEGLPFARNVSLENSIDSYLCFRSALRHSLPCFSSFCRLPSSYLCTVCYSSFCFLFSSYEIHLTLMRFSRSTH